MRYFLADRSCWFLNLPEESVIQMMYKRECLTMLTKGSDRRKAVRVPLNLLVQYRFDTGDELYCEYALDISEGGIFIRTDDPGEIGSVMYLQFVLKNGIRLIEGLGRIAHVSPFGGRVRGVGIQFMNLDDESKDTIKLLVVSRSDLENA